MAKLDAGLVYTQKDKRAFRQPGGSRPNNPPLFGGVGESYMSIEGVSPALSGGVDPIYEHDPRRRAYRQVGTSISAPDIPSFTVMWHEYKDRLPRAYQDLSCPATYYIPTGKCTALDDINKGWGYLEVYSNARPAANPDLGSRVSFDSDDAIEDSLDHVADAIYAIGKLSFGDNAAELISREVIDVAYGTNLQCGECGPQDDGTKRIYAITESSGGGSPGLPAELIYTLDGGATWTEAAITGIGATEDPLAIEAVGSYVVILGADAYYWADIDGDTGAPGTFTKVTSGFLSANSPLDMYALSASEIYFVGDNGYIYKLASVGAGVTVVNAGNATTANLARIKGDGADTLIAVGASGTVVKSINRGATWATTVTTPTSDGLQAVEVIDQYLYWVGSSAGGLYYTLNGGKTWATVTLSGSPTAINDIVFPTSEAGFIAYTTSGPAGNLAWTVTAGNSWATGLVRVANLPVTDRINRIAVPVGAHPTTVANNVALAALGSNGTDGALLVGMAAM